MNNNLRHKGFSLTEALIATGILALGLVMIAMAFPVGVKLASIATERPVGVVAGNEALCKMRLYGLQAYTDPNSNWPVNPDTTCTDYWRVYKDVRTPRQMTIQQIDDQRCYPSLVPQPDNRRYYWSALVRRANPTAVEIQATVFVCRMLGMGSKYYDMDHTLQPPLSPAPNDDNQWPVPVRVRVRNSTIAPILPLPSKEIEIVIPSPAVYAPAGAEYRFFNEGCFIVEDRTGTIYRVLEMKDKDGDPAGIKETLVLDKNFVTSAVIPSVWVIPPAIGSSRNPCIDVVQTTLTIP